MIQLLIAFAGGLGAVTRFVVDAQVGRRAPNLGMPLGTAVINITGTLLLGFIVGWWAAHTGDPGLKLAIGTGFLGGYTTFSTASVEAARLARAGQSLRLVIHAGGMFLLSIVAAGLGIWLGTL
jgi:CrcB protein